MAHRGCDWCGRGLRKDQDVYCDSCKEYFDTHPNKTVERGKIVDKKQVNEVDKKRISDAWKAFLDAIIEEDDGSIQDYYNLEHAISFELAMKIIQKVLKEKGMFEIGE